jgi:hypothetical protein
MLTAIHVLYVFIALQTAYNSSGTSLNWTDEVPNDFWISLLPPLAAAGSLATAGGFIVLLIQSRLTGKQVSQTQQEIDSTLRSWLGHISYTLDRHAVEEDRQAGWKDIAKFELKNYGRLPAKLTRQVQLWQLTEIKEEDLENQPKSKAEQIIIFPDEVKPYSFIGEQAFIYKKSDFYFGFILWYDFQAGEGRKEGKYGIIIKCKSDIGHVLNYSVINTIIW